MKKQLSFTILTLVVCLQAFGAQMIPLNDGWKFHRGFQAPAHEMQDVNLPHTWNTRDALFGNKDYFRGLCNYSRTLPEGLSKNGNRVFLKVGAAQTVADVFVDNKFVTHHRGGYTAFVCELTPYLSESGPSRLDIRVSNGATMDVAPICGDFNTYGGLPRGVELIVTGPVAIDPDCHGADGVFVSQKSVTPGRADLETRVVLTAADDSMLKGCEVEMRLTDAEGREVASARAKVPGRQREVNIPLTIDSPRLWDGVNDPYLYTASLKVSKEGREIDGREIPVGLRFFAVDPDEGFSLNGRPYRLNGVNRHEDTAARASAMIPEDHAEDVALISEMGCNAVRLSHYPQSPLFVDLLDREGMIAWIEIPFVNVFVSNPAYADNLRDQLAEMISQYYNHPSVIGWGLFNEINSGWMERPSQMVVALDSLAHALDPTRLTMGASNQDDDFNGFTDLIAFNKYFGWYGGEPSGMGEWLDREHAAHPERKIGMSEYGAGGSVLQHSTDLVRPNPGGRFHPENYQTYHHIETYRQLAERNYLWCNFIWCMFDFCAASRDEGDTPGRNDKGLVTYDRKTRKDAFYFYKANWNHREPMVHIAGKRAPVSGPSHQVMAFTNDGEALLKVNGKEVGRGKPDRIATVVWNDVLLSLGKNLIEVTTANAKDSVVIEL